MSDKASRRRPEPAHAGSPSSPYRHEAFLYDGVDSYLERTVPFIAEALADDVPVMVAVPPDRWEAISGELGRSAAAVRYIDMVGLGSNPARMVPELMQFLTEEGRGGRPLRGVGEPVWPGRRALEMAECHLQEALLTLAMPRTTPLWLLCPYDAAALPETALRDALRGHLASHGTAGGAAGVQEVAEHARALAEVALSPATGPVEELVFGRGQLSQVRRLTTRHAEAAGLPAAKVADLTLAVNELAANSLDHGGGAGVVRAWLDEGLLVVEVRDAGHITDPLAGRINPTPEQIRGRGLWMVHQLSDLVQVRTGAAGSVTRVLTWLERPPASC